MIQDTTGTNLYLRIWGKNIKVTAIADNAKEANDHMLDHDGCSVLAVVGELVIMADKDDLGE
jgi:hypothetical protein